MAEIVQTWKTKNSFPPILAQSIASWRTNHDDYEHRLLDDEELWGWLDERNDKFPHAIQPGKPVIRTIDMFRYCYLLERGGLYVDLDFFCLRSVEDLLREHPGAVVLGSVRMPPGARYVEHSVPNAWMYADRPGHPFWLVVLEMAARRMDVDYVERATGPVLLRDALHVYRAQRTRADLFSLPGVEAVAEVCAVEVADLLPPVVVLPPSYLYPLGWGFPEEQEVVQAFRTADSIDDRLMSRIPLTAESRAFTFWYHSWKK